MAAKQSQVLYSKLWLRVCSSEECYSISVKSKLKANLYSAMKSEDTVALDIWHSLIYIVSLLKHTSYFTSIQSLTILSSTKQTVM